MKLMQRAVLCASAWLMAQSAIQAQCIETANGRFSPDGTPCNNTIITAVPFLRIVPDARFGALGDAGLALSADPNSMHFNPSNIAFGDKELSVSATYTPWLRALGLNDVYLAYLSGYGHIDKMQTLGGSLRFFSLGQVQYTDEQGNNLQQVRPREFEFSFAYARKLGKNFSSSLALKYIYSNLGTGVSSGPDIMLPAHAFAADVSFTYQHPLEIKGKDALLRFGLAATNLGSKVSYLRSANRDYIPANLGLGSSFELNIDDHNSFTFALDINKLMVPTPVPFKMEDENGNLVNNPKWDADGNGLADYKEKTVPAAIFSSFGDAPFREEMRELMYSIGVEYWYNKLLAVRVGHYNEHKTKGNRKFMTVGLGIRYNVFNINFSYLIPTAAAQRNPLDNTLRFSLIFDFGKASEMGKKTTKPADQ
jgi:hypothetical protein